MNGQSPARPSASKSLGVHVARLSRVALAGGRTILAGYADDGRQIIAVPCSREPDVLDVYMRETPTSEAVREERLARKARRRTLKGIKAGVRNIPIDEAAARQRPRSHRAQTEDRAREILSRLSPIPAGGDELGDL